MAWIKYNGDRLEVDGNELHCGDCLTVRIGDGWCEDRIELDFLDRWYLVNHPDISPIGLEARL